MARATSEKVGRGLCLECGEAVHYRKSSGGMLTHKCESCDSSGFALPGGDSYKKRMATIKTAAAPDAPAPAAPAAPEPAPSAAKSKPKFSMQDL